MRIYVLGGFPMSASVVALTRTIDLTLIEKFHFTVRVLDLTFRLYTTIVLFATHMSDGNRA
jgi:hypothetical protein